MPSKPAAHLAVDEFDVVRALRIAVAGAVRGAGLVPGVLGLERQAGGEVGRCEEGLVLGYLDWRGRREDGRSPLG